MMLDDQPPPRLNHQEIEKAKLRADLRERRKSLNGEKRQDAAKNLATMIERRFPDHEMMAYVAHGSEVPTAPLLDHYWQQGRSVVLPLVSGAQLHWYRVQRRNQLRAGYRGILEPNPAYCSQAIPLVPWICLVPGLGFSSGGQRLGQGGGFYDRALLALRNGPTSPTGCVVVGVAFAAQLVEDIPMAVHDQLMDEVLVVDRVPP